MTKILELLSFWDIVLAALAALFLTRLIRRFARLFSGAYNPLQMSRIVENFYQLFPFDCLVFKGITFRRGMLVRVTTVTSKIVEGLLIGVNKDDELCVITRTYISTNVLDNIAEITLLEEAEAKD